MDCSMPGFPVLHYLPELVQTHVHWVNDAIHPSHPMLTSSKKISPQQHPDMLDQISGYHSLAKLTHRINHHISQGFYGKETRREGEGTESSVWVFDQENRRTLDKWKKHLEQNAVFVVSHSLAGELPTELPHRVSDKRKGRYLPVNMQGSIWEATRLSPLELPSVPVGPVCCSLVPSS